MAIDRGMVGSQSENNGLLSSLKVVNWIVGVGAGHVLVNRPPSCSLCPFLHPLFPDIPPDDVLHSGVGD